MGKFTKKVKKVLAYMLAGAYVLSKRMKRMIAILLVEVIIATNVFVSYADEIDDGIIVQMSVDEVEEMAAQQEESSESTDEGSTEFTEEVVTEYVEPLAEVTETDLQITTEEVTEETSQDESDVVLAVLP
ncbi:MAG: hypothetical protein J6D08_15600, partial [Lachnospiraceae bacterium]|nr:hypothetical protein [Lachnospiraceae bacterium]